MQDLQFNDPKKYGASQFAYGCSLFAGGLAALERLTRYGVDNAWTSALYILAMGVTAWGVSFAISYTFLHVAPALIPVLLPEPKQQEKQNNNVTIKDLPSEEKTSSFDVQIGWKENIARHLDGKTFRVKNRYRLLDKDFNTSWIYWIAQTRWEGKLSHVSERYLHEQAGIPRNPESKNESGLTPAKLVVYMLLDMELIESNRQSYIWTSQGKRVFPTSPTLKS